MSFLNFAPVFVLCLSAASGAVHAATSQDRMTPVDWVNTYIGTGGSSDGPDGYVTLMPETGAIQPTVEYRRQPFTHQDETSTPYYYAVKMGGDPAHRILAEMTATDHCGYLRFTFPAGAKGSVLVEATRAGTTGFVAVDEAKREITGYNPNRMDSYLSELKLPNSKGYFVVRFRQAFRAQGVYQGVLPVPNKSAVTGDAVGAYAQFDTAVDPVVEAQVGTSFISIDQARANLDTELPAWDFAATRDALKKSWNAKLGIATIEGASDDERYIFFTGLYHALLYPKLFSEHGRYYSAFDDKIHEGVSYTAFSIWDTFRAENSLLTLFAPERIDGMISALLQDFQEGGWMPKWPNPSYTNIMIGTHADSLVAEAIVKGFKGFDYRLAYAALYKDAMTPPDGDTTRRWLDREPGVPYEARAGLAYAKQLGYIPADKVSESASSTLEESYDDFAVAQVAKAIGNQRDYTFFLQRSRNYKNLFNAARGFMQARNADGSWADPEAGWTEGDQWVYLFAPLHDIAGVMALVGGEERFNAQLDAHFTGGHNRHDNEPSHHYGYLYDFGGQPWKTQAKVRQLAREAYANNTTGILGNEDCGQMSAWYVFTALGFYPLNPASAQYMIGSPLFKAVHLSLPNGNHFDISAPNNGPENVYIQSVKLNGKSLDIPVITYSQIEAGGKLEFVMGRQPSKWAANWRATPLAQQKSDRRVP
jgi:predicted alpha-1,2-mannosidase